MEIVRVFPKNSIASTEAAVLALGFFDGVHLGHRRLLEAVVAEAEARSALPAVFTFSDDAGRVKAGAACLTDFAERLRLFAEAGIRRVYTAEFREVSGLSPEAFVSDILLRQCGAAHAVCGFNFRFGKGASGDADDLLRLMRERGLGASVVSAAYLGGEIISSSAIRRAIEAGDMPRAAAMLGRPFSLTAPVLHGRGFGRTEGVPTVNQSFRENTVLPRQGVYACRARLADGSTVPAVANVGICPTFGGSVGLGVHCETHLIGYTGDLYGESLTVELLHYLRPEKRFETVEELYGQIASDVETAKMLAE